MRMIIGKTLMNKNYIVSVSIIELEIGNYKEAILDYGESAINFGGEINSGTVESPTVLAKLQIMDVKLSTLVNQPFEITFLYQQYKENTQKVAEAWIKQIKTKIEAYVAELSAKVDEFSGKEEIELGI